MSHYDDPRSDASGGGRWDSERFVREREERYMSGGRGPPVRERERGKGRDVERFERRLYEEDRHGPPARRPERRFEEDDDFIYKARGSGPLIEVSRHREEVSPPPRPRLLRRQSSLDTFDRRPARKLHHAPPAVIGIPVPRRRRRSPPVREREDVYEEIRIAEPEFYGDEEFRDLRERDRRRMRSVSRSSRGESMIKARLVEEETIVEKPYPRKGKTRMPKRLVNTRAVIQLGYPFAEEGDMIVIQKALSKELIDEVVTLSREMRRMSETVKVRKYEREILPSSPSSSSSDSEEIFERVVIDRPSRGQRDPLIIKRSPSRHRSRSRIRKAEVVESLAVPTVVRPRARSMSQYISASPVRIIEREDLAATGALVIRPKKSEHDIFEEIRALEAEKKFLQLERRPRNAGTIDIIKETEIVASNGDREEIIEVKKDRPSPDPRILRAMMASLT